MFRILPCGTDRPNDSATRRMTSLNCAGDRSPACGRSAQEILVGMSKLQASESSRRLATSFRGISSFTIRALELIAFAKGARSRQSRFSSLVSEPFTPIEKLLSPIAFSTLLCLISLAPHTPKPNSRTKEHSLTCQPNPKSKPTARTPSCQPVPKVKPEKPPPP